MNDETLIANELGIRFVEAWDAVQARVAQCADEHGWWETARNDGELIALMHSELSEALEGLRHGNPPSDKIADFSAAEEELADTVIRIMDMANHRNYRLAEAILAKYAMNTTRTHKHGKVF